MTATSMVAELRAAAEAIGDYQRRVGALAGRVGRTATTCARRSRKRSDRSASPSAPSAGRSRWPRALTTVCAIGRDQCADCVRELRRQRERRPHERGRRSGDARRRIPASRQPRWRDPGWCHDGNTLAGRPRNISLLACDAGHTTASTGRQPARRADVLEHAVPATWRSGEAHPAAVEDHPQAEPAPLGRWQVAVELELDLDRVVVLGQTEAARQPSDVGVDR